MSFVNVVVVISDLFISLVNDFDFNLVDIKVINITILQYCDVVICKIQD